MRSSVLLFGAAIAAALLSFGACVHRETCPPSMALGARDPDSCVRAGCPRFAVGDAVGGCQCDGGSVLLAGACVSTATADAYCGKAARYVAGACVFRECPESQRLDLASGACVPSRALRDAAVAQHITLYPGETLACDGDGPPALEGTRASCLPDEATCPRGARWERPAERPAERAADAGQRDETRGQCVRAPLCYAGEGIDPDSGKCVRLLVRAAESKTSDGARSTGYQVDVARWTRVHIGSDGGAGVPSFCGPLALRPATFGLAAKGATRLRVSVQLFFPNNDVTEVHSKLEVADDLTGRIFGGEAGDTADAATRPLVEALRALGGESSTAAVRTTVRCALSTRDRPKAVPMGPPDAGAR